MPLTRRRARTLWDELRKDHETALALLNRLAATRGDSAERRRLFAAVRREVSEHAAAEERTLYAALLADPRSQEKVARGITEHLEISEALEGLGTMDFSNPAWLRRLKRLRDWAEHHFEVEQRAVFRVARRVLSEARSIELARQFLRERGRGEASTAAEEPAASSP